MAVTDTAGRFEIPQRALPIPVGPHTRLTMECFAPGYGVFRTPYAAPGEQTVTLTALSLMAHDYCVLMSDLRYAQELPQLAQQVNEARAQMGLAPIDLKIGPNAGVPSCPPEGPPNTWGPFSGRVVDKHTDQPIPGAIFAVVWWRSIPMYAHNAEHFEDARVAVTDADGRFDIPRRRPPWLSFLIENPFLTCVAPGYAPVIVDMGHRRSPPIFVRMRALPADARRRGASWGGSVDLIPRDERTALTGAINARRREMGLPSVDFVVGDLERGPR